MSPVVSSFAFAMTATAPVLANLVTVRGRPD